MKDGRRMEVKLEVGERELERGSWKGVKKRREEEEERKGSGLKEECVWCVTAIGVTSSGRRGAWCR